MKFQTFREQVRRNMVALISLVVALTSLGYNTWRNEHTENNRNQRWASFEILLKLGEIRQQLYFLYWDRDAEERGNPRGIWVDIITIGDLSVVLKAPIPELASDLNVAWNKGEKCIEAPDTCSESKERLDDVLDAIEAMRNETLNLLSSLN